MCPLKTTIVSIMMTHPHTCTRKLITLKIGKAVSYLKIGKAVSSLSSTIITEYFQIDFLTFLKEIVNKECS